MHDYELALDEKGIVIPETEEQLDEIFKSRIMPTYPSLFDVMDYARDFIRRKNIRDKEVKEYNKQLQDKSKQEKEQEYRDKIINEYKKSLEGKENGQS